MCIKAAKNLRARKEEKTETRHTHISHLHLCLTHTFYNMPLEDELCMESGDSISGRTVTVAWARSGQHYKKRRIRRDLVTYREMMVDRSRTRTTHHKNPRHNHDYCTKPKPTGTVTGTHVLERHRQNFYENSRMLGFLPLLLLSSSRPSPSPRPSPRPSRRQLLEAESGRRSPLSSCFSGGAPADGLDLC